MRFHAPLCVLPPCASSLPLGGPHQRPDVIPGQPLQPACVILHASGPAARSFLSPLQSSRCGRPSFFFPAVSLLYPCPASIRLPATGLLCRTLRPPVAIRRDKRTSGCPGASYANRKWPSSALFTRPAPAGRTHAHSGALSLRVEPPAGCPHKTKRKESRGFPSSCQRGGHRASQSCLRL